MGHPKSHSRRVVYNGGGLIVLEVTLKWTNNKVHLCYLWWTTLMAKRTSSFELVIPARGAAASAHDWVFAALRAGIVEGRLRPGMRLASTRELAKQYGLARGTVVNAFDQLKAEGYIEGSVGSGTYVSKVLPDELLEVARKADAGPAARGQVKAPLSDYGRRVQLFGNLEARPSRAFRVNMPALDLFPTTLWAQVGARRLRSASMKLLVGCDPMGHMPLRQAVASYLSTSRGVRCEAGQVAIISGVQEALDLTARLLLNPGDRVCMEEPGYPGAAMVFRAAGARVSALPVDEEGMTLRREAMRGARLVYLTPGHQFPLGVTMSLARRLQLLDWAAKTGALILEDDYDSEYRYIGRPVPALQGLDRRGLVLFTGSFSKVLFPSLRLGYLVVPAGLVDKISAMISVTSRHGPLLEQAILCDFITEGHFGRHLRRMRQVYAERHSVLQEGAREKLGGLIEIIGIEAGLQTAAWMSCGLTGEAAAAAASRRNVEVTSLGEYYQGGVSREGLHLGFAAVDAREIRRGVKELATALESAVGAGARGSKTREAE
jgi:GntR family transcriptional regulator / MocR family aminotransferase